MNEKILIVDDSATDRVLIGGMLQHFDILMASNGLEAMSLLEIHNDVCIMILDLNMPIMNGFAVIEALKNNAKYQDLRIIILTNHDELDNEIKGLQLGAVDFLRKPLNMESLKVRVDIHVKLFHAQRLLEQEIDDQHLTFDTIFEQAPMGMAIAHADRFAHTSHILDRVNPQFCSITEQTPDQLHRQDLANMIHPDDRLEEALHFERLQAGVIKNYAMELRLISRSNAIKWVSMVVSKIRVRNNEKHTHICLMKDITGRKTAEKELLESERSKSILLSHLPGMAYRGSFNRQRTMQFVSAGCYELTGYCEAQLTKDAALAFYEVIAPEHRDRLWIACQFAITQRLPYKFEYEIVTRTGERKWVLEMGQGILNEDNQVETLEGIILDISQRKNMENRLRYNNEHDQWTGLYNRHSLVQALYDEFQKEKTGKHALIGINLSAIHSLTKSYGFLYSQDLIKKSAQRLIPLADDFKKLFIIHENQFVFYVKNYHSIAELFDICNDIKDALVPLFAAERIGFGVSVVEVDEIFKNDIELLMKNVLIVSEFAMHLVDDEDADYGICFLNDEIKAEIQREEYIQKELLRIADGENQDQLFMHFQPIVDVSTNKITEFEALARLRMEPYGMVPPLEFIPISEKSKLILPLGKHLLRQACAFLSHLHKAGHESIKVSINICTIQLLKHDFVSSFFEIVEDMNVNPASIIIEVTESVFSDSYREINEVLGTLREAGVTIAIDDFGTGYSTLAREFELHVDCLKIDKYFVDKLLLTDAKSAITSDIISMAHKLGHYVVAEGVEHSSQMEYLINHGCDRIQGFLISKPLPREDAIAFIKEFETQ